MWFFFSSLLKIFKDYEQQQQQKKVQFESVHHFFNPISNYIDWIDDDNDWVSINRNKKSNRNSIFSDSFMI